MAGPATCGRGQHHRVQRWSGRVGRGGLHWSCVRARRTPATRCSAIRSSAMAGSESISSRHWGCRTQRRRRRRCGRQRRPEFSGDHVARVERRTGLTTINGTLDSAASTTYRVEFFSGTTCHAAAPNDYGEGQNFLGFINVATDINGPRIFNPAYMVPATSSSSRRRRRIRRAIRPSSRDATSCRPRRRSSPVSTTRRHSRQGPSAASPSSRSACRRRRLRRAVRCPPVFHSAALPGCLSGTPAAGTGGGLTTSRSRRPTAYSRMRTRTSRSPCRGTRVHQRGGDDVHGRFVRDVHGDRQRRSRSDAELDGRRRRCLRACRIQRRRPAVLSGTPAPGTGGVYTPSSSRRTTASRRSRNRPSR